MQVQHDDFLLIQFSSNTLPNTATFTVLEAFLIEPTTITDIRFKKADTQLGDIDITTHEIKCLQISKNNLDSTKPEIKTGDWLLFAGDIEDISAYIATYNTTTGLFGSETLLFDIVPNINPTKMMRILSYSFDDEFLYITCILTKQNDNAASLYFDGRYTLLNNNFPYTILSRQIFQL